MANRGSFAGADAGDGRLSVAFGTGVENRAHLTRVGVRAADNVDIDKDGVITRRQGYTLATTLADAQSLWSHPLISWGLVAAGSTLYRVALDGSVAAVAEGLKGGLVSYAMVGQRVRWSDGVATGQLDLAGLPSTLGVETPTSSFLVQASNVGGMDAARYGVTVSYANGAREEGGAPDTVYVDVPAGGGIQLSALPAPVSADVAELRVYVTPPNGVELFYAASAAPGTSTLLVGAGQRGRQLTTQFMQTYPAATHLLAKAGRLLGASGRALVWSAPMYYGLHDPIRHRMPLPAQITMLAAPDSTEFVVYVGTVDKTYVLQGESIDACSLAVATTAGVIPGSMAMVPAEALKLERILAPVPVWVGTDGVPYAGTVFGAMPLSDRFAYPIYDQAAAAFVQGNGMNRFIVTGQGGRPSALAVSDRAEATVIEAGP